MVLLYLDFALVCNYIWNQSSQLEPTFNELKFKKEVPLTGDCKERYTSSINKNSAQNTQCIPSMDSLATYQFIWENHHTSS